MHMFSQVPRCQRWPPIPREPLGPRWPPAKKKKFYISTDGTRAHTHTHTHAQTHAHTHTRTRTRTHAHTHAHTHPHTHTPTRTPTCTQTCSRALYAYYREMHDASFQNVPEIWAQRARKGLLSRAPPDQIQTYQPY